MRHHQSGFRQALVAVENQIEIERSRRAGGGAHAAVLPFDCQQPIQQWPRRQVRLADDHAVQVARLRADADRRGIERRGLAEVREKGGELTDGKCEVGLAIAEIAAERDGDRGRDYSTQRAPMTAPGWSLYDSDVPMRPVLPAAA